MADALPLSWSLRGLEKNRRPLEAVLRYSSSQGLAARPLTIEEAFVPDLDWAVRV